MQNLKIEELDSNTEDLGIINEGFEIPDEVKTLRMFLKDACEEANLKWARSFSTKTNQYCIKYEYGKNIRFSVGESVYARFVICSRFQEVEIHIIPRGDKVSLVIDKMKFEVADPEFHEGLVKLIKKMNRGYDVR